MIKTILNIASNISDYLKIGKALIVGYEAFMSELRVDFKEETEPFEIVGEVREREEQN